MSKKQIFPLIMSLLTFFTAAGKTWYVSNDGNDTHSGETNRPFKTIQKGADMAQPGDTVLVREGVYRERVAPVRGGREQAPIVFLAQPGKRVFIKGSDVYEGRLAPVENRVFSCALSQMTFTDDVYFDSPNPFKVPVASTPWLRDGAPEGVANIVFTLGQVFVNGVMYRQYPLRSEMLQHKGSWWYDKDEENVLIHFDDNDDPNRSQIELTTRRRIFAPHIRGLGYIHVVGFVTEHCGNQYPRNFWETKENAQAGAVGTRCGHHWLIKNNVVRYAANIGIDCGTEGPDNERAPQRNYTPEEVVGNRVEHNYIVDNGCTGVTGFGSKETVVSGNVVMYNNNQMYRGYKRYESAGVKFHNNIDCIVTENLVTNNFTYGVWFDNKYPGARICKNVIANNYRSGVFLEMGDYDFGAVLVDYNVIVDNSENQIYIHDASGGLFVNNLVSGSKIVTDADGKPEKEPYGQAVYIRQVGARTKTYHHAFYNNIFCNNDIVYDINYPMWRSGEQRFLGNVYDKGALQGKWVINPASDFPRPVEGTGFRARVASDLALKTEEVPLSGNKIVLNFGQWQNFWAIHSMHYEQRGDLSKNVNAAYIPATQSVVISLSEKLVKEDNTRWNTNFKARYKLEEHTSYPGPFGELKTGNNEYTLYKGLPVVKRGELAPSGIFQSFDRQ